jgi:hypothetical protein
MTFSESHPHLNVLNDERYSSYQVRVIHNVGLNIFFLNCTADLMCEVEFKHLVKKHDGTNQCTGCRKDYPDIGEPPVLRTEELSDNRLDDPKLERWIAAWLGVEQRYVTVNVEK